MAQNNKHAPPPLWPLRPAIGPKAAAPRRRSASPAGPRWAPAETGPGPRGPPGAGSGRRLGRGVLFSASSTLRTAAQRQGRRLSSCGHSGSLLPLPQAHEPRSPQAPGETRPSSSAHRRLRKNSTVASMVSRRSRPDACLRRCADDEGATAHHVRRPATREDSIDASDTGS